MRDALTDDQIRQGWRLACCAVSAGRVVVEVEQWSLPVLTDEARVPIEPRTGRGAVIDLGTTTRPLLHFHHHAPGREGAAGQAPALADLVLAERVPHGRGDGHVALQHAH